MQTFTCRSRCCYETIFNPEDFYSYRLENSSLCWFCLAQKSLMCKIIWNKVDFLSNGENGLENFRVVQGKKKDLRTLKVLTRDWLKQ